MTPGFESRWTNPAASGTVRGPMAASRLPLTLAKMPAGAGHSWVGVRQFAIASTNDQPRGR
jgi:hypothetical protein